VSLSAGTEIVFCFFAAASGERIGYGGRDMGQGDKGYTAQGRQTASKAGGGTGADAMSTTTSEGCTQLPERFFLRAFAFTQLPIPPSKAKHSSILRPRWANS
jgi:hypothetical protein